MGAIRLYKTFALYEIKQEFNVLHGRVTEYNKETTGDVKIAAIIDGVSSSTIPSKNDGYIFESVTCDNDATARWDNNTWEVIIGNLTKIKTTCTLVFKTKPTLINYITKLAENSGDLAYDETEDNNIRYIGANPNNYVKFNNELWRIIGVMNNITDSEGNIGSHIKIIRNESIGEYYWDSSANNDWTQSILNIGTLNGTYYNGLTSEAKNMISNVVWNLGGRSTSEVISATFYTFERGDLVYSGHATTWTGKIGLMYVSDYGYAVGGSVRNTCLETNLKDYNTNNCYINNWVFNGNNMWTLIPRGELNNNVFAVRSNGSVARYGAYDHSYDVIPVLYLNSNIEIIADETHKGSSSQPYELKQP